MVSSILDDSVPRSAENVVFSRVSEGGVLLATDEEIYYGLNELGAQIWELMGDGRSVEEICQDLHGEYPEVEMSRIRADVKELLADLVEYGLVHGTQDNE